VQRSRLGRFNELLLGVGLAGTHVMGVFVESNNPSMSRRFRAESAPVGVPHDRHQPCSRIAVLITVKEAKGPAIGLLYDISRIVLVAGEPPRKVVSGIEMGKHYGLKLLFRRRVHDD
jgi:hypothetical protein